MLRGINYDITEQVETEEKLRESEERYRLVAENASDVIITIDDSSTILYVNRAAERVFGYKLEEMIGQSLTRLMPEYLRHLHEAGIARYTTPGTQHLNWEHIEIPGLHRDGHESHWSCRLVNLVCGANIFSSELPAMLASGDRQNSSFEKASNSTAAFLKIVPIASRFWNWMARCIR